MERRIRYRHDPSDPRGRAAAATRTRRQELVLGLVTLIVSESVAFIAYFLGQALLSAPAIHTTIGSPGALRAVVGCGLYVCLLGLFALGLATMIRHTAGAISAFIGVLLVLPIVIQALPSSIAKQGAALPPDSHRPIRVVAPSPAAHFAPWPSLLLLAGYAAASLVIGGVLLVRRDA